MRCWRDGTSALKPMVKSLRMGNIIIWFFISIFQISKPSERFLVFFMFVSGLFIQGVKGEE